MFHYEAFHSARWLGHWGTRYFDYAVGKIKLSTLSVVAMTLFRLPISPVGQDGRGA